MKRIAFLAVIAAASLTATSDACPLLSRLFGGGICGGRSNSHGVSLPTCTASRFETPVAVGGKLIVGYADKPPVVTPASYTTLEGSPCADGKCGVPSVQRGGYFFRR